MLKGQSELHKSVHSFPEATLSVSLLSATTAQTCSVQHRFISHHLNMLLLKAEDKQTKTSDNTLWKCVTQKKQWPDAAAGTIQQCCINARWRRKSLCHISVSCFYISQLPKLCVKITIFMQSHVLIADWSVAHFIVIVNDVMNDNMAAFAHVGARLGAFFYWTRFLENNVPFDNIPLQFIWSICSGNWVRIRVRLRVALF